MNLYRGCQHQCIYCDSRSECYQIENFDTEVLVKANAIELLEKELARKRVKGTIGTGSMNDPYMPLEGDVNLTGRALKVIARFGFPVHIMTKSGLVLRDLDTLCEINTRFAAVSFTITAADDELAKKLEPGAPLVSARFEAMKTLSDHGIHTGITMMPILPFIEDDEDKSGRSWRRRTRMEQRTSSTYLRRSLAGMLDRRKLMNVKRLVVAGIVASVLFLVLDAALGMAGGLIGSQLFGLPAEQPPGFEAKVQFGLIFELINGFMLAVIYAVIHPSLPGQGWRKGISYGLIS